MQAKRACILTGPGYQDHDVIYTYYRFIEEGWDVDIATKNGAAVSGKYGVKLPMDKLAAPNIAFEDLAVEDYDVVVLTGGHEAPDRVRQDRVALDFIRAMAGAGKVVAGLCHGPWIMISAGILRGRTVCAYVGMRDDMINSGANVIEGEVVRDGNLITCSYYRFVGAFMRTVFQAAAELQPALVATPVV